MVQHLCLLEAIIFISDHLCTRSVEMRKTKLSNWKDHNGYVSNADVIEIWKF